MVANSMDNIKQILEKFIADLELKLSQDDAPWARGYFRGQIDAYKVALMLIDTEILLRSVAEKSEELNNKGGKNDL
jgi:hypothetical protein